MALTTRELDGFVGRRAVYTAPEEVGRAAIRYFARAVGDPCRLYVDAGYARRHGYEDVIAPPTFVCETNQYMPGEPDKDGYPGHSWGIEIEGTRMIRGGHEYEFHRPLYPSDVITATWTITDVYAKRGSSGRLTFLVSEARYTNQQDELIAVNRETLIFQEI